MTGKRLDIPPIAGVALFYVGVAFIIWGIGSMVQ